MSQSFRTGYPFFGLPDALGSLHNSAIVQRADYSAP
jgi:hypothetical protein